MKILAVLISLCFLSTGTLPSQASRLQIQARDPLAQLIIDSLKRFQKDNKLKPLIKSPSFQIVIESLEDDIPKLDFNKEDIKSWAEAELARSAPKAKIIDATEASKGSAPQPNSSLLEQLSAWDARVRTLSISIEYKYYKFADLSAVTIDLHFTRGVISLSGFEEGRVYNRGFFGIIGTAQSFKAKIRDAVQELIKDFGDKWTIENKEVTP
jgi:hypothetical protein